MNSEDTFIFIMGFIMAISTRKGICLRPSYAQNAWVDLLGPLSPTRQLDLVVKQIYTWVFSTVYD